MVVDIKTLMLSLLIVTVVNVLFLVTYNLKHKDIAIKFFIKSNYYYVIAFVIVVIKENFFNELGVVLQNLFLIFGAIYELMSMMLTLKIIDVKKKPLHKYFITLATCYMIFYFLKFDVVILTAIIITMMLVAFIFYLRKLKKNDFIVYMIETIYISFFLLMVLRIFIDNNFVYNLSLLGLLILRMGSTLGFLFISREKMDKELLYYANYDGLTNLLNRRTFISESEFFLKSTNKKQCVFLLIDIDFFKKINDTYGHLIGDNVLIGFSEFLKNNFEDENLCGRYGGEEFTVLLKNTDEQEAMDLANRLLVDVSKREIDGINFTISIGLSVYESGKTIDDLYKEADVALYKAKNNGRNRAFIYENENHF